jgi:hypothetical protein
MSSSCRQAAQWQVNDNSGASHEVIAFVDIGAAHAHPSDVSFTM